MCVRIDQIGDIDVFAVVRIVTICRIDHKVDGIKRDFTIGIILFGLADGCSVDGLYASFSIQREVEFPIANIVIIQDLLRFDHNFRFSGSRVIHRHMVSRSYSVFIDRNQQSKHAIAMVDNLGSGSGYGCGALDDITICSFSFLDIILHPPVQAFNNQFAVIARNQFLGSIRISRRRNFTDRTVLQLHNM